MVPKYTVKFELKEGEENDIVDESKKHNYVIDIDYNNLKRIQGEIEDALKAIDATYSKKVFKFLK